MLKKIKREICLIKYRNLPLLAYDEETDSDVFYRPKCDSFYWIKLEDFTSKKLVKELIKLLTILEIENLLFLDEYNKSWISEFTANRKDYKPLIKTLEYFKKYKIWKKFNGGVLASIEDLDEFLPHFYRITCCDSGFFDYNFIDENQNIIFYIHYSGEINITTLNKEADRKFLEAVKQTQFVDSFRDDADRI